MKTNYGIIAYEKLPNNQIDILEFIGYEEKPTPEDFASLFQELNTDPEHAMVGRLGVDVYLMLATDSILEYFKTKLPDET
jgi:hypothetical protein